MSNLLKSLAVNCKQDKKIIDSNEAINKKLIEIRKIMTENPETTNDEFTLGLNAAEVDELLEENPELESSKINAASANARAEEIIAAANAKAENILAAAQSDADRIVDDAKKQADLLIDQARKNGYDLGVEEGRKQTQGELDRLNKDYEARRLELETDYNKKVKEIEPDIVDALLDLFADITKVLSEDKKDMIMTLADSVLDKDETSNNFIIRACREDAEFLKENKEKILSKMSRDVHMEIVEDMTMKKNQCFIDTDLGVYDCSLDIQLENLVRDIKILSCGMGR